MSRPDASLWPLGRVLEAVKAAAPGGVEALGERWERELEKVTRRWRAEVSPEQQASAEQQVETAVNAGDLDALAVLAVPVLGAEMLLDAMRVMAAAGAASVVAEAKAQGVELPAPPPLAAAGLADWARVTAERLAGSFAANVRRVAMQLFRPGAKAAEVVEAVRAELRVAGDTALRGVLGGALTRAQNLGRLDAYRQVPPGSTLRIYATEALDASTCDPCRRINGAELPTPEAAALAYGGAGYLYCEGGERCRGTVVGVWTRDVGHGPADDLLWPLGQVLRTVVGYDQGQPRDPCDGLSTILGHLPGRHDQKSHGRRKVKKLALSGEDALKAAPIATFVNDQGFIEFDRGVDEDLVQELDADALAMYQGSEYEFINGDLRSDSVKGGAYEWTVGAIDAAMSHSKLGDDVIVHRGLTDLPRVFSGVDTGKSLVGLEYVDAAYVSTTADLAVAEEFGSTSGALLNIRVPKGTGAIQLSSFGLPPPPPRPTTAEAELMLQRGLKSRVVGDQVIDGRRVLEVEVVSS